mmetsp:Transcript_30227/g.76042  ORF Transcript_30227/g.76042 Transcript_30227/m.76042 type:complete len:126 (-) Transcript_30227:177-554(-)
MVHIFFFSYFWMFVLCFVEFAAFTASILGICSLKPVEAVRHQQQISAGDIIRAVVVARFAKPLLILLMIWPYNSTLTVGLDVFIAIATIVSLKALLSCSNTKAICFTVLGIVAQTIISTCLAPVE